MTDLCRCGHLIQQHCITTGRRRKEECNADYTGLFDKCKCSKVRPIDNLGYLEGLYNQGIKNHG